MGVDGAKGESLPPSDQRLGSVHRILRNGTFNLAAQGLNAAFNIGFVWILGNHLNKEGIGAYYAVFAWIMVIQQLAETGTSLLLTRRLIQKPDHYAETVAEATGLFGAIGLASILGLAGVGAVRAGISHDPEVLSYFIVAGVACAFIQVQRFAAGIFRAHELFGYENLGRILQGGLLAGLAWLMVEMKMASVASMVAMLAVSHGLAGLFLVSGLWTKLTRRAPRLNLALAKDWLREAIPLGLGDVTRNATWQLDTLMLDWLQPEAVVGIYSIAYRPLGPLNWLPKAVLAAAFPSFARMAAGDRASLRTAFANSTRLLWIISLPLAIAVCAGAEFLIAFLAPDCGEAVVPMRILIWVAVLSFLSTQFRFVFAAVGQQNILARLVIGTFLIEAVVELVLIPFWGYFGACAGTLAGEMFFTVAGLYVCRRLELGEPDWGALLRAGVAAAGMGAWLWLAHGGSLASLLLNLAGASTLYLILCIALRALHWREVQRLFEAFALPGRRGRVLPHPGTPQG
jgi:O-antigen/teichoic acid export membrane protein